MKQIMPCLGHGRTQVGWIAVLPGIDCEVVSSRDPAGRGLSAGFIPAYGDLLIAGKDAEGVQAENAFHPEASGKSFLLREDVVMSRGIFESRPAMTRTSRPELRPEPD